MGDIVIPEDMMEVINQHERAFINWNEFPPSARRGIREWIFNAKRPKKEAYLRNYSNDKRK